MIKVKPPIVYVISALMLAAAAFRGVLQAFELNNDYRWLILGLLALFGALLFSEIAISRKVPSYLNYYFFIEASIAIILILLPLFPRNFPKDNDFFALLFIPLCVQAIFYFKRSTSYYWVIGLVAASVAALQIQYGFIQGIKFSITYILAYTGISYLAILYVDAEDAKNELDIAHQKLQKYAANAEELAVAEERNRLARDLHDSVTQSLYSLTLFAEAASEELSAGEVEITKEHLKEVQQTSQQALQEMRLMIFELRPPELDTKGLALALQERLEGVESRTGIETVVSFDYKERLSSKIELGLYGIAREALNNILKHSQATEVKITLLKHDGNIVFEIEDNGKGIDISTGNLSFGLGIRGMKERANQIGANLVLENVPNGGTLLRVEVPDEEND